MDANRVQLNIHYGPVTVAQVTVAAYEESDDRETPSTTLLRTNVQTLTEAKLLTEVVDDQLDEAAAELLATGVESFDLIRYTPRGCGRGRDRWTATWRHPRDGGMATIEKGDTASDALRQAARTERKRQKRAAVRQADMHLREAIRQLDAVGLADDANQIRNLL